jgi:hypothetical protein
MDQGAIANFKAYYLWQTVREMIWEMANCSMSVKEYCMSYNILKGIENINTA